MNKKSYTHLSFEERETLSLGLAQGHSLRTRVTVLGRTPSILSREATRHATRACSHRACAANMVAMTRTQLARGPLKLLDPWLWRFVQTHLGQGHSPEQIAGRLRREYPDDMRGSTSQPRPSTWASMCCPMAPCAASCWLRCGRPVKPADLGNEALIAEARSLT